MIFDGQIASSHINAFQIASTQRSSLLEFLASASLLVGNVFPIEFGIL